MVAGKFAGFCIRDLHDVFDAAATEAGIVEAGFHGYDGAFAEAAFDRT